MSRVVGVEPGIAYHIGRVKRKLATGVYQTEPVACFCGSTSAQLVTDKDRYGFDHAMWLCKDCGVIYANPRMTEASYAQFYAEEYRHIYDHEEDGLVEQRERGLLAATALRTYLQEQHGMKPAVVFDIGCNAGTWLEPFVAIGAEVHGVDYGPERVALGQTEGLPIEVGSIEALELMGVKADLIIMNHVLEHATNLEATLLRVRDLLKPDGMLYVAMPGLLVADLGTLFQNAHPWQFTAETLAYVMECCGFDEIRADHTIVSLWKKSTVFREKEDRPTKFIRDITNALFRRGRRFIPHVRTENKFPRTQRRAWIQAATERGIPEIIDLEDCHTGRSAVIIGGGPSINDHIETIRTLQSDGALLFSIERMYPWCQAHGLVPTYVVIQDASDDVTEGLQHVQPGSTFLIASQCQAAVFDAVAEAPAYFFHTAHDLPHEELKGPGPQGVLINAGGSVVLCSFSLAMGMGIHVVHFFGFDCHVTNGGYATGIAGVGEQADFLNIKIAGRAFRTTPAYLSFAQQFFELKAQGMADGLLTTVKVYGDSMVPAMTREKIRA